MAGLLISRSRERWALKTGPCSNTAFRTERWLMALIEDWLAPELIAYPFQRYFPYGRSLVIVPNYIN
jgi:hypothetical protein